MADVYLDISKVCGEHSQTNYISVNVSAFLSIVSPQNSTEKLQYSLAKLVELYSQDIGTLKHDKEDYIELYKAIIDNLPLLEEVKKARNVSYETAFTLLAFALILNNANDIKAVVPLCIKEITAFLSLKSHRQNPKEQMLFLKKLTFLYEERWIELYNPRLKSHIENLLQKELESANKAYNKKEEMHDLAVLREASLRIDWIKSNPPLLQSSFDDIDYFSKEYLEEITMPFERKIMQGAFFSQDLTSKYVNVKNGERKILPNKESKQNKNLESGQSTKQRQVFILGSSVAFGWPCEDAHTIQSHLQNFLNSQINESFICRSYAINSGRLDEYFLQIENLNIQKNDIIIAISEAIVYSYNESSSLEVLLHLYEACQQRDAEFYFFLYPRMKEILNPSPLERIFLNNDIVDIIKNNLNEEKHIPLKQYQLPAIIQQLDECDCISLDLQAAFNRPHDMGEIYVDSNHVSNKGNYLLARYIFNHFFAKNSHNKKPKIKLPNHYNAHNIEENLYKVFAQTLAKHYEKNTTIDEWCKSIQNQAFENTENIGAIIMNCNPFTLGHLYLIQEALTHVDKLYVFIVEENSSDFSFASRLKLVQENIAFLNSSSEKIKVFPSGNFIISALTFPEYFQKSSLTEAKVDSSEDIALFGSIIAPRLNIKTRFIGEEPLCNVTNQYNSMMKKLLPKLGLNIIEIPRKEHNRQVISASRVRKLYREKKWEEVKELVPLPTYLYLLQNVEVEGSK